MQSDDRKLRVLFNPLAFTTEEVNEMMAEGYEPLPHHMWRLTDERRREQETCSCGSPKKRSALGCGPSGCINVPC